MDRLVRVRRKNGKWEVRLDGATRAYRRKHLYSEIIQIARKLAMNNGRELVVESK